ncbi:MAG TPA: adenylosuccinate lyase, partial [Candidatus Paceibacterota bacterium]|nr:adenylosuccinate lyase [Candidatus Paceibacterota bacterium]
MDNDAINPLDGRYFEKTRPLAPYFSEEALMKWRIMVECEFFIYLANSRLVGMRRLKPEEISRLRSLYKKFSEKSYQRIKEYERNTNHDVKAVEYFIKESLQETALLEHGEW